MGDLGKGLCCTIPGYKEMCLFELNDWWSGGGWQGSALPSAMSSISWNCRGLGNFRAIRALKRLVLFKDPAVIFLCETTSSREHTDKLISQLQFQCVFTVPSSSRSGNLFVLWKEEAQTSLRSYSSNHIDLEVWGVGDAFHWRLTFFYGFLVEADRYKS